jgi:glycosyltransferase involved in cell wall biosynthesis
MGTKSKENQLTVWIINPYGNIPGEGWRDYRSTLIAKALTEAGHKTVWWVSNFEHRSKSFRSPSWEDIEVNPDFMIRVVPSTPYTSHISLSRVRYEKEFARRLCKRAAEYDHPDIIVLAEPALFVSPFVLKMISHWKTKLVIDILDLWPEIFHIALPGWFSKMGRLIFFPLYMRRAALFRRADAIVAVTKDYLEIAQDIVDNPVSAVIYLGVDVQSIQAGLITDGHLPKVIYERPKAAGEIWAIYAGTLGNNYDIRTILRAVEMLEAKECSITILIAGDGPLKSEVLAAIESNCLKKLIYVGSLSPQVLTRLYAQCDIALSTYVEGSTVSMPLKAYDYMAAGLPIVNSLGRELGTIIRDKQIGIQYIPQNPASLSHAIQRLTEHPEMRNMMSENAKSIALSFDEADQHRKFVGIIERVMR